MVYLRLRGNANLREASILEINQKGITINLATGSVPRHYYPWSSVKGISLTKN
jgi:hypothetical protein